MPWSADLPGRTQSILSMLAGIVLVFLAQAVWWGIRGHRKR
jgi:hypothetical protein